MSNVFKMSSSENERVWYLIGQHLKDPLNYTAEEFIHVAEKALIEYPNEWLILFSLGDRYQAVGRYADSIRVLEQCVKLRPNEIKSSYGLATTYHMLTWATFSKDVADKANTLMGLSGTDKVNPEKSQTELDRLNITAEAAAVQAIKWFNRSLELKPDPPSRQNIMQTLQTIHKRFPSI